VKGPEQLGEFIATFKRHKVRFSFNTDGPEMLQTNLRDELKLAIRAGWVTKEDLTEHGEWAKAASFVHERKT
jgi:adenosine deaminase